MNDVHMVDLIRQVSRKSQVPPTVVKRVLDNFRDVTVENIEAGRRVVFRSFGAFYRRDRKEGVGRDIRNGNAGKVVAYGPKKQLAFSSAIGPLRNL